MTLTAVLLAAGASRRMGNDNKLLLPWLGRPMVGHAFSVIAAASVDEIVVVTGHEAESVRDALPRTARAVHNPDWVSGMASTIACGVRAASSDTRGYLFCLGDQPLLEVADLDALIEAFLTGLRVDARCVAVPFHADRRGNPVLFAAAWRDEILARTGRGGCRALIDENPEHVHALEVTHDRFHVDLDTPETYRRMRDRFE